ncbi:uncharacterized protein LOC110703823 [Chenopodium quinoa]|uniref:uncharacterized protein LOC110703823 n=1 Tax=Chenopodium quinoa TaxID=63459 RepID=UPI000B776976|nr:uncharacterized protein LOC110703823 [Chenopodium quinoa]
MITKGRDVKKYCMFHRDVGHYTEECVQLKENIEDLIRKGRLSQYRTQTGPSRQQTAQPRQTEYRKQGDSSMQDDAYRQNHAETSRQGSIPTRRKITIDVITGGPVYGGSVSGEKKSLSEYRHLVNALSVEERPRPSPMLSISFSEEDAKGIVFPHDDPLVLVLTVNGADIKRKLRQYPIC